MKLEMQKNKKNWSSPLTSLIFNKRIKDKF